MGDCVCWLQRVAVGTRAGNERIERERDRRLLQVYKKKIPNNKCNEEYGVLGPEWVGGVEGC